MAITANIPNCACLLTRWIVANTSSSDNTAFCHELFVGKMSTNKEVEFGIMINWLGGHLVKRFGINYLRVRQVVANESPGWLSGMALIQAHDDVTTRQHFPHYWLLVSGMHQSPVDASHRQPVMRIFMFLLTVHLIKLIDKRVAGYLRRHRSDT